jgi:hypothetical protein
MAQFQVYMLAFNGPDKIRTVSVPDSEVDRAIARNPKKSDRIDAVLGLIYHYGQNDVQTLQVQSVSIGDVIRYAGGMYVVQTVGFAEIDACNLMDYLNMSPRDRCFSHYARPDRS